MPSQLLKNDRIGFICCRTFVYGGEQYHISDEFPGEKANNIETLVRARYVIPVVEKLEDKPRHWHLHVKLRSEVEERLARGPVTQIVFENEPDDDEQVNLEKLTHPEPEEPNQADHMAEVADARILTQREAEAEAEPEEETEPEAETEPEDDTYRPFSSNEEQLLFTEREEAEPPEPPDPVVESSVPAPEEEPVEDEPEEPGSAEDRPEDEQVPHGTLAQVLTWVGDDPDRAQQALDAEEAGKNRPRLKKALEGRIR